MKVFCSSQDKLQTDAAPVFIKCCGKRGKTASAFILLSLLSSLGKKCAYIDKNGFVFSGGNFEYNYPFDERYFNKTVAKLSLCGVEFILAEECPQVLNAEFQFTLNTDTYVDKIGRCKQLNGMLGTEYGGVFVPIVGKYAVADISAAVDTARCIGFSSESLLTSLPSAFVPGRLQNCAVCNGASIILDYAHTGSGYSYALNELKQYSPKRLICVAGCSGLHPKRAEQIGNALTNADYAIITSEDRYGIPFEYCSGLICQYTDVDYEVIEKREDAIRYALRMALPGDIVLIAGKGMERFIYNGSSPTPFDEMRIIKDEIAAVEFGKIK